MSEASYSRHALPVPDRSEWQPQHVIVNEHGMVHIPFGPYGLLHLAPHDARDLRDRLVAADLDDEPSRAEAPAPAPVPAAPEPQSSQRVPTEPPADQALSWLHGGRPDGLDAC